MSKKLNKKQMVKYDFHGEPTTSYKIIQLVNEEGSLELTENLFLNTREQLIFENEEIIKNIENELYNEPDNEDLQEDYDNYQNTNFRNSSYWLTDSTGKIIGKIKNYNDLDAFIAKKKILNIV